MGLYVNLLHYSPVSLKHLRLWHYHELAPHRVRPRLVCVGGTVRDVAVGIALVVLGFSVCPSKP